MACTSLNGLPDELHYLILEQLDSNALCALNLVSKQFYRLSNDNLLWKRLLKKAYENLDNLPNGKDWKSFSHNQLIEKTSLLSKFFGLLEQPIKAKLAFLDKNFYANTKIILKAHYPIGGGTPADPVGEGLVFIIKTFPFAAQAICVDYNLNKAIEEIFDSLMTAESPHFSGIVSIGLTEAAMDHEKLAIPILSAFSKFILLDDVTPIHSDTSFNNLARSPAYRLTIIAIYHEHAAAFILSTPSLYQCIVDDADSGSHLSQIASQHPKIAQNIIFKDSIFYKTIINAPNAGILLSQMASEHGDLAINIILFNPIFYQIILKDNASQQHLQHIAKRHKLNIPAHELTPDRLRTAIQKKIETTLPRPTNHSFFSLASSIGTNIEQFQNTIRSFML